MTSRPRSAAAFDDVPPGMLRRFTVDDLHKMAEAGIVRADESVQLLGGRIVVVPPPGDNERAVVDALRRRLAPTLGGGYDVRGFRPLRLDADNEPWPDLAVVRFDGGPESGRPRLVVEASCGDALRFDRTIKAAAYAVTAVPEYWVVDLDRRCTEVQRSPDPASGTYRVLITLDWDAALSCEGLPGVSLVLAGLLA